MKERILIGVIGAALACVLMAAGCPLEGGGGGSGPDNPDKPAHYYPFSENANDAVGGSNGVLKGNAVIADRALVLDGDGNSYVEMPRGWVKEAGDLTVELWAYPEKTADWQPLFEISTDASAEGDRKWLTLSLYGDPNSNPKGPILKGKKQGSSEYALSAGQTARLPQNQWSHIAAAFKGGRGKIYVNGELVAEDNTDGKFPFGKPSDLGETANNWIGKTLQNKYWGNPNFKGRIMEYKIYYRVLGAAKIAAEAGTLRTDLAMQGLNLKGTGFVTEDLDLPTAGPFNSTIAWVSDKPQYISNAGAVTLPETGEGEDVTLTATLTLGGVVSGTKTFTAHVPSALGADKKYIENYLDYILNDGVSELPPAAKHGSTVSWQVVSGGASISGGKVVKTSGAAEKEQVRLKAVISRGGVSETINFNPATLMDPFAAYVLSYFDDDYNGSAKLSSSSMRLAYGFDGKNWNALNGTEPVLQARTGSKFMRDPFILRKKDGSLMPITTQGWTTPQIYFWDSDGLTDFTNERLVKVSQTGVAGLKGDTSWAPEASYDLVNDIYYVYWADPGARGGDGPIYYNTTEDFITVSDPGIYFDAGRQIIDASIFKHQGAYYLTYKDETGSGKDVWIAKSESLEPGSFRIVSQGPVSPRPVEGPFIFKSLTAPDTFYMYYDFFETDQSGGRTNRLAYSTTGNIAEALTRGAWAETPVTGVGMPSGITASHGGVVGVTVKELERIRLTWNPGSTRGFADLTRLIAAAGNEKRSGGNLSAALNAAEALSGSSGTDAIAAAYTALFEAMEALY